MTKTKEKPRAHWRLTVTINGHSRRSSYETTEEMMADIKRLEEIAALTKDNISWVYRLI